MRGLLRKIVREVWLGTLLFGIGLFVAEGFFAFIIPQIEDSIGTIWSQMPWVKNLMSAMLGIDLGDDMTSQVLLAIVWVHPVVLSLVCAHELILGTRVPAAEIDRGTIDVLLGWPVSRGAVYLAESAVWAVTGVFILLMALAGHVTGVAAVGTERAPGGSLAAIMVNLYALYLAVGGLTFLVSALSDRRGRVIAIVFAVLVASLLLNFLGQFWPPAERVALLGVLHYYQPASVLRAGGFPVRDVTVLTGFAAVTWSLGLAHVRAAQHLHGVGHGSFCLDAPDRLRAPRDAPVQSGARKEGIAVTTLLAAATASLLVAAASGDDVVWTRSYTDATYRTADISIDRSALIAGTYLNPPEQAELVPLGGDGTEDWSFAGNDMRTSAARNADVFAAADFDDAAVSVTVHKWHAASSTPDWSYEIEGARPGTAAAIAVSDDGSVIAVLVTLQTDPIKARLVYFGPDSKEPLGTCDAADGFFGRNLSISEDGSYIAFIALATVYVVDTKTGDFRYSVSAGASNDALAISGDGRYLAYGWTTLFLREWTGTTYGFKWSRSRPGLTLTTLVLSADEQTLVAAWKPASNNRNSIELHDSASTTPRWTYSYEQHGGQLQDVVADLAITGNGSHVAVGSWGDDLDTNPEVHVFEREPPEPPEPALTVDTPGSMFDVDVARGPRGRIHVAAAGKHIHANTSGRGGDLFSIVLATDCNADIDGNAAVDFDDLLAVLTAWGPVPDCPPSRIEDLDDDCDVGFSDLLQILSAWGGCE